MTTSLGPQTALDRNFAVVVLALVVLVSKDQSRLFSRLINYNLLAFMSGKNS